MPKITRKQTGPSAKDIRGYQPLVPQETGLVSGYKDVQLVMCKVCGRIRHEKRWTNADPVKEIEVRIEKGLIPGLGVTIDKAHVDIDPAEIETKKGVALATVSGTFNGNKLHQEYDVPFSVLFNLCDRCSKNNEIYYEGAIQLRAVTPEIYAAAMQIIKSLEDRGVFANKIEENGEGNYDIRLSNQRFIKTIGLELQRRFGGSVQNDAKLFSYNKQTSKNIYRVNVTYTSVPFKKHDIVTNASEDFYCIDAISKHVHVRSLDNDAPFKFDAIKLRSFTKVPSVKVTISKYKPKITVLHPQTYQETELSTIPGTEIPNITAKTVKAIVVGSRLFYDANQL